MCRVAIQRFAEAVEGADWKLELYDIRPEVLDDLVELLPSGSASVGSFDLFDGVALSSAIEGAALVVGRWPYIRTAEPVRAACIDNKVAYLDLDDDEASTRAALVLDAAARQPKCRSSSGVGVARADQRGMDVDAARDMDSVDRIDVCWVTGDEGAVPFGRAVLDHAIRGFAGQCQTWEHGRPATHQTFVETDVFALGDSFGAAATGCSASAHPKP